MKHKFKMEDEERCTGIAGAELTEVEELLEKLLEISEETEKRVEDVNESGRVGIEREKVQDIEMRQRDMERIEETRRRDEPEDECSLKKSRSSGEAIFEWLRKKA